MAKKVYYVEVPFTGKVGLYIAAESEKDAIDKAFDVADINGKNQSVETEFHRHVTQGNMCSAILNNAWAEVDRSVDLDGVDNPDDVTDDDYAAAESDEEE